MHTIRISQINPAEKSPNVSIQFDSGGTIDITLSNISSIEFKEALTRYFEEYLTVPQIGEHNAARIASSIREYGESLFSQVFQGEVLAAYNQIKPSGANTFRFEINGSPDFIHQIHWEALKDPDLPLPFSLQSEMVRTVKGAALNVFPIPTSPTLNILMITARPFGHNDVAYHSISFPLVEATQDSGLKVRIDIVRPGTYFALEKHLQDTQYHHPEGFYHIFHFDGHGSVLSAEDLVNMYEKGFILLNNRPGRSDFQPYEGKRPFIFLEGGHEGQADPVEAQELADLLTTYRIPVVILNACQSGMLTESNLSNLGTALLEAGLSTVVAMSYSVTVTAAKKFMPTLYKTFVEKKDLNHSLTIARKELYLDKKRGAYYDKIIQLEDWLLPVVYQNGKEHLNSLSFREYTDEEEDELYSQKGSRYPAPRPRYGFVGRDYDILQIERMLLDPEKQGHNILLIQGMGGSGKTTLLHQVAYWWNLTGFIRKICYFGYDAKPWTLDQIIDEIIRKHLGIIDTTSHQSQEWREYTTFQTRQRDVQIGKIVDLLRANKYLLIFDNLETITGTNLAIGTELSKEEQHNLKDFLSRLGNGRTLVLLSSRGKEEWLFNGNQAVLGSHQYYFLKGLDPMSASILFQKGLNQHVRNHETKEQYQQAEAYSQLLNLLNGYPLPIEIITANFAQKTPEQILYALQQGDLAIDLHGTEERTESLVGCIQYSYANLPDDLQKTLLILEPFTTVFLEGLIESYLTHLNQIPAFTDLTADHWARARETAMNWGLISEHHSPGFLTIHPILPYFLKTRLSQHSELRAAIRDAFRRYYDELCPQILGMRDSKEADVKQFGQMVSILERENIRTALELCLEAKVRIIGPYRVIYYYFMDTHNPKQGYAFTQEILDRIQSGSPDDQGPFKKDIPYVLSDCGSCCFYLKQYSDAEQLYQEAVTSFTEVNDGRNLACILHMLGYIAQEQRDFNLAKQYYQKSLDLKTRSNEQYSQASTYHNLGMIAQIQQEFDKAEQFYQKALQIFQEFNDKYQQSAIYHQLGMFTHMQGEIDKAEQYYLKALQICQEYKDQSSQAPTYGQLGRLAQDECEYEKAEQYYQKALQIFQEVNDRYSPAKIYYQLGIIAQKQGDLDKAEQYFLKYYLINKEFNERY